jgi:predicted porin
MKKYLFMLASAGMAGEAPAQSSVTVFGGVDMAVTHTRGSGDGSTRKTQLASSGNAPSRLGFRGVEDLGGGLSANFWLEMGVFGDTGTGLHSTSNNQVSGSGAPGVISFNRRSTVGFAGRFGEVRLGRDILPTYLNTAIFDPFGTGGIGASQIFLSGLGGLASPVPARISNSIGYLLPADAGGFYGQVMYAMGENDSTSVLAGTGVSNRHDGNHAGVRLGYANRDFTIAVATGKTRYAKGDLRVSNLGAAYFFGPSLMNLKLVGELYADSKGTADGKGTLVGFHLPIGAGEIKGAYSRYRLDSGHAALKPTSSKLAIGYVHNLSKRTALYATVARVGNSHGAAYALMGATTARNRASTGTECGMRHMF